MGRYIIARILQAILVLWAAFTVSFVLLQALPGDEILIKFENPDLGLSKQQIAEIRVAYGADVPLYTQYLSSLGHVLTGQLGYSIQRGVPVVDAIAANLPSTLGLTFLGFVAAASLALGVAFVSTLTRFASLRALLRGLPSLFISLPVFWLGIVLIQIFSFQLKLIPVIGAGSWEGIILPVFALAIPISAPLAQVLIRSIDEVETQGFVAVARAKGASRRWVLWRHVFRNAIPPTLTIGGVLFGELLAGAVITETVFGRNGLGRLTEQAVNLQDAAILQAVVLIAALGFVIVNLIVDLILPILDPRLRKAVGAMS
jgi:peptide/nickel transport system permease protein